MWKLRITTSHYTLGFLSYSLGFTLLGGKMFRTTHRAPSHPGEILLEDFLKPLNITQSELADKLGIPFQRVNQIVKGRRSVTPATALRLSRLFGTSVEVWLNLQTAYDVYEAEQAPDAREIQKIRPLAARRLATV
jgi:antitoxin HigA-1